MKLFLKILSGIVVTLFMLFGAFLINEYIDETPVKATVSSFCNQTNLVIPMPIERLVKALENSIFKLDEKLSLKYFDNKRFAFSFSSENSKSNFDKIIELSSRHEGLLTFTITPSTTSYVCEITVFDGKVSNLHWYVF